MYEILVDLPIQIPLGETYRYMGFPANYNDIPGQIIRMVEEEVSVATAVLKPRATYHTMAYDAAENTLYNKEGHLRLIGSSICMHLSSCTKVTIFTCTVGPAIDPLMDTYFKKGEYTRALIIDAIGSAAVEYIVDTLNQYLNTAAYRQQHSLVSRFSPGYGGWGLTIQKDLVDLAGGAAIGIKVTDASLLIPRKSVSGIIGWVPGLEKIQQGITSPCTLCQIPKCKNPICKGGAS